MAREPYDIFVREFLQHPAWDEVLQNMEALATNMKETVILGSKDDFDRRVGRVEGVYEVMALLRGLINKSKDKG